MPSVRISKELSDQIYFITFTVKNWYYIFDRHNRFQIIEDSFVYCQEHKDLEIFDFVFMLNYLHFIAKSPNLINTIKELKTFLSYSIQKNIIATEPSVIGLFKSKQGYSLWEPGNYPELI